MAIPTTKNWTLNSYTNDTWTDLVAEPSVIAALIIANTGAGDAVVDVRLEDGGASLAVLVPTATIGSAESYVLDMRSLNVTGTQAVQVRADVAGVEFTASGVIDA